MSEQGRQEAQAYVDRVKGFYRHLVSYILVNIVLIIVNLLITPRRLWFYWITIFWGLGLFIQLFQSFGPGQNMTKRWEERKIANYMKKYHGSNKKDSDNT